eukprot:COSAG02_NODE_46291_length_350_cov_0.721116_1_plen_57_part_00
MLPAFNSAFNAFRDASWHGYGIGVIIQHDLFVPTGAYRVRIGANSGLARSSHVILT